MSNRVAPSIRDVTAAAGPSSASSSTAPSSDGGKRFRRPRLESLAAVVQAQTPIIVSGNVWTRAFWSQLVLLRNAFVSTGTAWLLAFFCSLGTLSSAPVAQQSYVRFLTATLVWSHFFFCATIFVAQACFLARRRFLCNPQTAPSFFFCLQRLYRRTYYAYFATLVLMLALIVLVSNYMPTRMRKLRLEFYFACVSSHVYTVAAILSMRRIVATQTVGGAHCSRPETLVRGWRATARRFCRVFVSYSALIATVATAGLFVQAVRDYRITTQTEMLVATAVSTVFKLLVQQAIKTYVLRRSVRDIRTMCVAVALPTVLIDTQLRLALQRVQSTQLTLGGIVLMALLEIGMRVGKIVLVTLEIWWEYKKIGGTMDHRDHDHQKHKSKQTEQEQVPHEQQQLVPVAAATTPLSLIQQRALVQLKEANEQMTDTTRDGTATAVRRASQTSASTDFERWKKKLLAFHTVEIYADMSAEYIAIGCSTAIFGLCWNHPKYELHIASSLPSLTPEAIASSSTTSPSTNVDIPSMYTTQRFVAGLQIGAEIVIDYFASVLEIRSGIDFYELRKFDPFIACVFINVATVNVLISVVMYMRTDSG